MLEKSTSLRSKEQRQLFVKLNGRTSDSAEVEINGVRYLVYAGGIVIDVFERLLRKGAKHQAKTYLFERASSYSKLEEKE